MLLTTTSNIIIEIWTLGTKINLFENRYLIFVNKDIFFEWATIVGLHAQLPLEISCSGYIDSLLGSSAATSSSAHQSNKFQTPYSVSPGNPRLWKHRFSFCNHIELIKYQHFAEQFAVIIQHFCLLDNIICKMLSFLLNFLLRCAFCFYLVRI